MSELAFSGINGQSLTSDSLTFGMYGRAGVDFAPNKEATMGRGVNLSGMGSLGGRLEEGDYLEFITRYNLPVKNDKQTKLYVQTRFSAFSKSGTFVGFYSTGSINDLIVLLPEAYVEAKNLFVKDFSAWAGARFYRGDDIHIADYYYFNDLSSQGAGVKYKDSELALLVITSPDSSIGEIPPYVYNNLVDGSVSRTLRQRTILAAQQKLSFSKKSYFQFLAEYHWLSSAEKSQTDSVVYPSDYGLVGGIKFSIVPQKNYEASAINLSVRLGTRIANGGSGSNSRTYTTYGGFDYETEKFEGAYSINTANEAILRLSQKLFHQYYFVGIWSHGAPETEGKTLNILGEEIFNSKQLFAVGMRSTYAITPQFLLINELHYTARKDGTQPYAEMIKFAIAPTFSPSGKLGVYARPHIRFVYSIAWYNLYSRQNLSSPYLSSFGENTFGHYFGIKSEWWF